MKNIILFALMYSTIFAQTPFNRGVNLTTWFQADSPQEIQFTKYTKQDFINIKSLGCDVVRLPINLHSMTLGEPGYELDPLFRYFLNQVINWCEELGIHLILDNHTFDPSSSTDPNIHTVLIPVWKSMAEEFKNRSNLIYYEILNEPHGISNSVWNTIQQATVEAIREIDSVHTIIVGPADWNSYNSLNQMPVYSDTNLIYTFHFYDPFLFTHQGATWGSPTMEDLAGVPFPYSASEMPNLPNSLVGTWVQNSYNSYSTDGTITKVKSLIDIAYQFAQNRNVNIFCGEFGVYIPHSNNDDRVFWYEAVRQYFEEKEIAWTMWDYQGGFGLFEKGSYELFDYDLNIPLVNALGLNEVEQKVYQLKPDSTTFSIYEDFIESGVFESSWSPNGELSFYANLNTIDSEFCISWSNPIQYESIGFDFTPDKDLTYFTESVSQINFSMWLKVSDPTTKFDIRFIDSKTDVPEDHPWRMRYTVDNSKITMDGNWQNVKISLNDFEEHGSWDNDNWYNPIGAFNWSEVDRFEIVAEHKSLAGINLFFDDIKFVSDLVDVKDIKLNNTFSLFQNYPNPFNPSTKIKYIIPKTSKPQNVTLKIFDSLGKEVNVLVDKSQSEGEYEVAFNAANLSSGVYFYQLKYGNNYKTKQMLLLK